MAKVDKDEVVRYIAERGPTPNDELVARFGPQVRNTVYYLIKKGVICIDGRNGIKPIYVLCGGDREKIGATCRDMLSKKSTRSFEMAHRVLSILMKHGCVSKSLLVRQYGMSFTSAYTALEFLEHCGKVSKRVFGRQKIWCLHGLGQDLVYIYPNGMTITIDDVRRALCSAISKARGNTISLWLKSLLDYIVKYDDKRASNSAAYSAILAAARVLLDGALLRIAKFAKKRQAIVIDRNKARQKLCQVNFLNHFPPPSMAYTVKEDRRYVRITREMVLNKIIDNIRRARGGRYLLRPRTIAHQLGIDGGPEYIAVRRLVHDIAANELAKCIVGQLKTSKGPAYEVNVRLAKLMFSS
jgi:predicted transcriptional regulator